MELGKRIRERRKEKKYTLEYMSNNTGMKGSTYNAIEGGRIKEPSVFKVLAIAAVLEISVEDLVAG